MNSNNAFFNLVDLVVDSLDLDVQDAGDHKQEWKKPHLCDFVGCGKSFLRPAHLVIHSRIHTGEKPYVCEYAGCGKRWNQKSALKQHMRCHTGEKPFLCNVKGCSKRFSTSSSCKRHISTHKNFKDHSKIEDGNWTTVANDSSSSSDISAPNSPILELKNCAFETLSEVRTQKMAFNFILN